MQTQQLGYQSKTQNHRVPVYDANTTIRYQSTSQEALSSINAPLHHVITTCYLIDMGEFEFVTVM